MTTPQKKNDSAGYCTECSFYEGRCWCKQEDKTASTNEEIIADYFTPDNGGEHMIFGEWYTPKFGCDSVQMILEAKDKEKEAAVAMTYDNAQLVLKNEIKEARKKEAYQWRKNTDSVDETFNDLIAAFGEIPTDGDGVREILSAMIHSKNEAIQEAYERGRSEAIEECADIAMILYSGKPDGNTDYGDGANWACKKLEEKIRLLKNLKSK